ncbi:hypothetical protein [Tabrizicola sp. BL-A-41-H6]|uniref:hypothetical protein n=1 Tax=Tabrizicola sp. BL-A-41-H6 TaxID=3421107 RepID=UPI003D664DCB
MKAFMGTVAAMALLSCGVVPAAGAVDFPTLTCGDFTALDSVARLEVANEVLAWIHAENSTQASPDLIAKYAIEGTDPLWTGEKMKVEIEGHCVDASPDMLVLERLDEHS